mgnify:CR=1 FL=1
MQVPFYLQAHFGNAGSFAMKETVTFNWVSRTLTVEVVNETARPMIEKWQHSKIRKLATGQMPWAADQ